MLLKTMENLWISSGFATLDLPHIIMLLLAFALIYLAIVKQFEPLVLLPIAFGILLANLPITGIMAEPVGGAPGGLLYYLYQGVKLGIYPSLIFVGIGARPISTVACAPVQLAARGCRPIRYLRSLYCFPAAGL